MRRVPAEGRVHGSSRSLTCASWDCRARPCSPSSALPTSLVHFQTPACKAPAHTLPCDPPVTPQRTFKRIYAGSQSERGPDRRWASVLVAPLLSLFGNCAPSHTTDGRPMGDRVLSRGSVAASAIMRPSHVPMWVPWVTGPHAGGSLRAFTELNVQGQPCTAHSARRL